MERRIFIVLDLNEECLPLKLTGTDLGLHIIVAPHNDTELELGIALARHTEVPLLGIMVGRISSRHDVPMIEIISDFKNYDQELKEFLLQNRDKEINKLKEIFSFTTSPLIDYAKELNEIIKQENLSFFHDKKEVNSWKWRKIQQTKFNRQIRRSKWQTCRSRL